MKHAMIAFNPEQADTYEFVDFDRCCVFRMKNPVGPDLVNRSIAVVYRTHLKALIGEFEVVRVETINEPKTPETEELYRKAFGYPVTLYDGEFFGPTHIFFRNLRLYSPSVPFDDFMKYRDKRGIKTMHPISYFWLDEDDLDFIRNRTASVTISEITTSTFVDPYKR